jgi:hypothetical protein
VLGDLGGARVHFERADDVSVRAFGETSTRALGGRLNPCLVRWREARAVLAAALAHGPSRTAPGHRHVG